MAARLADRKVTVLSLCCGVETASAALSQLGAKNYCEGGKFFIGDKGDICSIDKSTIPDVEIIRSKPFKGTIAHVKDQAARPSKKLKIALIENVKGIENGSNTGTSPMDGIIKKLNAEVPGFKFWFWEITVQMIDARELLDPDLGSKEADLTEKQVGNLAAYRMLGRSRCKEGKGDRGKVWFYDLSRSSGKVRKLEGRFDGVCPCLTTRNGTLWVEAAQSPKYRRFLSFGERFAMQGLPSELADTFSLKGRYIADLFAGSRCISRAGEALGFRCRVFDKEALAAVRPTHVVLGPGPGRPDASALTAELASEALSGRLTAPLLGVCLGHQALGLARGWELAPSPLGAVHGVPEEIFHDGLQLFAGLPSPATMVRYNSLVLRPAPNAGAPEIAGRETPSSR
ncbi:unnamed protein product [Prorocentrum cordatum]|uniref:anthranilate synthase n=1 Tax=Prorocentrum cordatum TaxID=2364126 RepID=A0ABN9QY80_9DINO|nr:unnamed protein product [Polarella glacialis]